MSFKRAAKCFRIAFGLFVFVLPENFLTVMCIQVFQKPSEQWNKLVSENLYVSNALKMAELNPVNKFQLGPFESVDDSFYKSSLFLKTLDENSRNILEKMAEVFVDDSQQKERKKAGDDERPISREQKGRINRKYQVQEKNASSPQSNTFSSALYQNLRDQINKMKLQIKKLRKLSRLILTLKAKLEFENISVEYLEKLMEFLEEESEESPNKTTIDKRLKVDSIFFINRLSVESSRKETDAQIAPLAVKDILNNLKEESYTLTSPPTTPYTIIKSYELDLIKQLQKNFSKIFHNQDVTLEQINQMSRIVDFVERYHGIVGNLKSLDLSEEEAFRRPKEKMTGESRGARTRDKNSITGVTKTVESQRLVKRNFGINERECQLQKL